MNEYQELLSDFTVAEARIYQQLEQLQKEFQEECHKLGHLFGKAEFGVARCLLCGKQTPEENES